MPVKSLVVLIATLAAANGTKAAELAGAWIVHGSVFFNAVDTTCLFKGEGSAISATCENDGKPGEYTPVAVTGNKLAWSWNAGPAVLAFAGALASDTVIKGEITVRGFTGKFTATKQ